MMFTRLCTKTAILCILPVLGALFLTACPETPTYPFVCENGTPGEGSAITANIQLCASCNTPDFVLEGSSCVAFVQDSFPFVCENGTPETSVLATAQNIQLCTSCNTPDFVLQGSECVTATPDSFPFICENGTPEMSVRATTANVELCASCDTPDYVLQGSSCVAFTQDSFSFVCENGTAETRGTAPTANVELCASCNTPDYELQDGACVAVVPPTFAYVCENGTAESGTVETADTELCTACNSGYVIDGTTCLTDTDRDGIADTVDIDDDNDGLIEIATLTELHNIRYNLSGTSYDTDEDDAADNTGTTAGAPTAATGNCETPVDGSAPSIYLCGYELAADLDFDTDGNGTWVDNNGTYTLDSTDNNSVYFPIENGNGGWQPIGVIGTYNSSIRGFDSQVPFAAIFEGNNFSISNLAIQRDDVSIGLFAVVGEGARIRNVVLRDALISNGRIGGSVPVSSGALAGLTYRAGLTGNYGTGITVAASDDGGGLFGNTEFSQLSANRVISATLIGETSSANTLGALLVARWQPSYLITMLLM